MKPHDIAILVKIHCLRDPGWTFEQLGASLLMSPATIHESLGRMAIARLYDPYRKEPVRAALAEFLIHGVRYVFPAVRGPATRGMPTGFAAPPLQQEGIAPAASPPVWPHAKGSVRGYVLPPIYVRAPLAAEKDVCLYRMLALVDAIRDGTARERQLAVKLIAKELGVKIAA